ncbi:hypothetical protein HanRHA438_Chr09g0379511 [Helianthus annuus]|nr:hypothetical protein HanRHA438_Chr09g0379511 [Helianthus annuus]
MISKLDPLILIHYDGLIVAIEGSNGAKVSFLTPTPQNLLVSKGAWIFFWWRLAHNLGTGETTNQKIIKLNNESRNEQMVPVRNREDGQVSLIHDGCQNQLPLNFVLCYNPNGDY